MGDIYSVGDVVGKTLIGRVQIPVYRDARDDAKSFGYVKAGQPVGVVYSWLDPSPAAGRSGLWWVFYDTNQSAYYTPHKANIFDVNALRQQGVISTKEQVDEEKEKEELENLPWYEQLIKKYGKYVVLAILGAAAIKTLPGLLASRRAPASPQTPVT